MPTTLPTSPAATAQGLMQQLARTAAHGHSHAANARQLAKAALKQQRTLRKRLPELAERAQAANGEERGPAHREYLAAVQSLHRLEQAFQQARRQQVILASVGYGQGTPAQGERAQGETDDKTPAPPDESSNEAEDAGDGGN